jgi:hypothetical protein
MGCYGLLRDDFDLIMVPSRLPHAPEADPCAREAPAPEAGPCVTEGSTEAGPSAEPPTPLRPPLQALDAMPGDTNRCERISGAAKAPTHPARLRPARCPPSSKVHVAGPHPASAMHSAAAGFAVRREAAGLRAVTRS